MPSPKGPRYSINSSRPIDPDSGVPKPKSARPNPHSSGYSGSSSDSSQVPEGSRKCGSLDAGTGALPVAGIVLSGHVRIVGFARGHVLGPDQALDQLELAVVADGDDAPGDGDILAPVDRAGLDRALDLVETRLVGTRLPRPILRSSPSSSMLASSSLRVLKRSISAFSSSVGSAGCGRTRPKARGGAPVHVEPRLCPFPASLQFPRRRLEAVHGELVQQIGIVEPDPPLVLLGEQIAVDLAPRRLVSLNADETRDGGCSRLPGPRSVGA